MMPLLELGMQRLQAISRGRTVREVAIVYVGKLSEAAIRFAASIIVARILGPERLGILMTIVVVAMTITIFMKYALDNVAIKFVADRRARGDDSDRVMVKAVGYTFALATLISGVASFIGAPYIAAHALDDPALTGMVRLGVVLAAVNSGVVVMSGLVRAYERFGAQVVINTTSQLLRLALLGALVIGGLMTVTNVIYSNMFAAVLIVIGDLIVLRHVLLAAAKAPDRDACRQIPALARYSWWMFLSNIIGLCNQTINVVFLKHLQTAAAVGHYSAAFNVLKPFEFFPESITQVMLPKISRIRSRTAFLSVVRKILLAGILLALPVVPLLIFPRLVLRLLFGADFEPAAPVVMLFALRVILSIVFSPCYVLLHRLQIPGYFTVHGILTATINTTLAILLVPGYGAAGAAMSALVGYAISTCAMMGMILWRAYHFDWSAPV